MLNQVSISGRLGRDPESRAVGGSTVTNFSLAVSEKYKDKKTGEMIDKVSWIRVSAWGKTGEIAAEARKGDELVVHGALETKTWEKDGQKRDSTEVNARIVFRVAGNAAKAASGKAKPQQTGFDDEIPF